MFPKIPLTAFALFAALVRGQQIGTNTAENHPALAWQTCTTGGSCTNNNGAIVLDANWRWVHSVGTSTNCYNGNQWDATLCPTGTACAANCALDGANYAGTYGITTSGSTLRLNFVTGSNVGSRVYLLADTTHYEMFTLLNTEFTFTVNVANLPCGLNGALYFSEMSADGGLAAYSGNKAGAQYGTGYCDSQCPRDIKFIDGVGNVANWTTTGANTGTGSFGSCCNEMDVWEANSVSAAYTPHPCSVSGQTMCSGAQCGYPNRYSGVCDPDGCDFNSYRMGATSFYGPHETIDTTQPFTVVTQFLTSDNTTTGTLSEIRRLYVQNGVVISNSKVNIPGLSAYDSVTDAYCTAQKTLFGGTNSFAAQGGLTAMGNAFKTGVVLVMSIWDDYAAQMLWLDSDYPTTGSASTPGVARGTCGTTSGVPSQVESQSPNSYVEFSNIKFGPIGSTFSGTGSGGGGTTTTTTTSAPTTTSSAHSTTSTAPTTTSTASGPTQTHYGQCGGQGWTGPTTCASPYTCMFSNPYYSQCL